VRQREAIVERGTMFLSPSGSTFPPRQRLNPNRRQKENKKTSRAPNHTCLSSPSALLSPTTTPLCTLTHHHPFFHPLLLLLLLFFFHLQNHGPHKTNSTQINRRQSPPQAARHQGSTQICTRRRWCQEATPLQTRHGRPA